MSENKDGLRRPKLNGLEHLPKVGVVGYGYWGPNLVRNLIESTECVLAAVCDKLPANLAKVKHRYPWIDVTERFEDLLADDALDAIVIATPVGTHFKLATAALQAGKHVMVEKPLAASSSEAEGLVNFAKKKNLTLMAGHTFEYSAPVLKAKEIIDSGELGEIYYVTSKRVNLGLYQHDVSVIWDLGPHDFSIIFHWLDQAPSRVSAFGRSCVGHTHPDVAFVNLAFPSGVVAEIQLSWLSPVKLRRTLVVGSKKMLLYDDTENVEILKIFDHGVGVQGSPSTFGEFQLSYRTGDIVSPKLSAYEPLAYQVSHFVESIRTGKAPRTGGESGLRVVRCLEAAEESFNRGGEAIDLESFFSDTK